MFMSELRFLETHRLKEWVFKEERNPVPKTCSKVSSKGGLQLLSLLVLVWGSTVLPYIPSDSRRDPQGPW